jgi:imidazolonepropionase-like amidohydrolase
MHSAARFKFVAIALAVLALIPGAGVAQDEDLPILFTNVNVFDGVNEALIENANVLVQGNLIAKVSEEPLAVANARIIDGGGRTLMPGLIDAHTHFTHCVPGAGIDGLEVTHWSEMGAMATVCAKEHLMNGFTTVREMGEGAIGPGLKKSIDKGYIPGPRIYPSGAYISQTSGHADFLSVTTAKEEDSNLYRLGVAAIADGPDEVRTAVRKQLSLGASQIKLMGGGGVSSLKDPIHSSQYTAAEMSAAVEAAQAFDTYVGAHVYQDVDIRRSLESGLLSIEHGQFMTDDTANLMVEKGAFLSLNLAGTSLDLFKHPVYGAEGTPPYVKSKQFQEQAANLPEILKNNPHMKIVFNTDLVFSAGEDLRRGIDFEKFMHYDLLGSIRALRGMTSLNGKLMALTGKMNPYPDGKLGVIEEGAYADILLVDGNPLEDMTVIGANPKWFDADARDQDLKTLRLIMKDGKIYKNTLSQ